MRPSRATLRYTWGSWHTQVNTVFDAVCDDSPNSAKHRGPPAAPSRHCVHPCVSWIRGSAKTLCFAFFPPSHHPNTHLCPYTHTLTSFGSKSHGFPCPQVVCELHAKHWAHIADLEALNTYPKYRLSFDFVLRKHGDFVPFNQSAPASKTGAQLVADGTFLGPITRRARRTLLGARRALSNVNAWAVRRAPAAGLPA
jgi:hypothetical protein